MEIESVTEAVDPKAYAAVDLGSNSFHLIVAQLTRATGTYPAASRPLFMDLDRPLMLFARVEIEQGLLRGNSGFVVFWSDAGIFTFIVELPRLAIV